MLIPLIASAVLYTNNRHETYFKMEKSNRYAIIILAFIFDFMVSSGSLDLIAVINILMNVVLVWYLLDETQTTEVWRNILIASSVLFVLELFIAGGIVVYLTRSKDRITNKVENVSLFEKQPQIPYNQLFEQEVENGKLG